jgi:hypothetical protein
MMKQILWHPRDLKRVDSRIRVSITREILDETVDCPSIL